MRRVAEMVASAPLFGVTGLGDVAAGQVVKIDGVWHRPSCVCPAAQAAKPAKTAKAVKPSSDAKSVDGSRRSSRRRFRGDAPGPVVWSFDEWARQLADPLVAPCCATLSDRSSEVSAAVGELECAQRFIDAGRGVADGTFSDLSPREKVQWLCHVLDLASVVVSAAENACSRAARLFDTDSPADMYVAAEFRSAANAVAVDTARLVDAATTRCEDPDLVAELCAQLVLSSSSPAAVADMLLDQTPTMFAVPRSKLSGSNGVLVRAGSVGVCGPLIVSVLPFFAAMSVLPALSSSASWNHVALVPGVSLGALTVAAGLFDPESSGPLSSLSTALSAALSLIDTPVSR